MFAGRGEDSSIDHCQIIRLKRIVSAISGCYSCPCGWYSAISELQGPVDTKVKGGRNWTAQTTTSYCSFCKINIWSEVSQSQAYSERKFWELKESNGIQISKRKIVAGEDSWKGSYLNY